MHDCWLCAKSHKWSRWLGYMIGCSPGTDAQGRSQAYPPSIACNILTSSRLFAMKHRVSLRKLNRSGAHRRSLFRNLVTSLIEHERIETTVAKAKDLRRIADRVITQGKIGTLAAKRRVGGYVQTRDAAKKVFTDLAPRFAHRDSGYTRLLKTRFRRGDCAPMAVLEWSDTDKTILTPEQLMRKEQRKSKYQRQEPGLADAIM